MNNIFNLDPREYEHDFDRRALGAFKSIPGAEKITKEYLKFFGEKSERIALKSQYLRIQGDVFPEIYNIVEKHVSFFSIPVPEIYFQFGDDINAYTFGLDEPVIVITSGCVEKLDIEELDFIIAHEIGHIHNKHYVFHTIANTLAGLTSSNEIISGALKYGLLYWSRMSEFTADRAGLLATGKMEPIYRAFIKISGFPPNMYDRINIDSYKIQCNDFDSYTYDTLGNLFKTIKMLDSSHPWNVIRMKELEKWISSADYGMVLDRSKCKILEEQDSNSLKRKVTENVSNRFNQTIKSMDNLSINITSKLSHKQLLKKCAICGNSLNSESLFCSKCGHKQSN